MKFLLNLCNHSQIGQRSLEDPIWILIHQLRALGHEADWRPANDQLITGPGHINIMVEGFTIPSINFMKHYYETAGARFIILATEEPTPNGFNHGIDPEMRLRQKNFPEAAKYAEAIWYLVPGAYTHNWYSALKPAHYVELGYAPSLIRIDNRQEPQYDFGFYGSITRRRLQILKRLARRTRREKAVRLMGDFRSQEERDAVMRQAKVIILVRKFDKMGLVSSSRCNTALCIGRPVLGEPHDLSEEWEGIIRFSASLERFYDEALLYRAAWKGLHASQFERFKTKLTPEVCIGRAFDATGIRNAVGFPRTSPVSFDPKMIETVKSSSQVSDAPQKIDDEEGNRQSVAASVSCGMNLHGMANQLVKSVNPNRFVSLQFSSGSTTTASGLRVPQYSDPVTVSAQVQQLSTRDLMHLNALNIQGSMRKIYLFGQMQAIVRVSQRGGDLITLQDGTVYLTTAVLEQWSDGELPTWVCVSVTLQNGS